MPGGRRRSESVTVRASPFRAMTMPFISVPSTNPSRIASRPGDSASAEWRCDSRSPAVSIRKRPRCPPESTGLRTAGRPTVSSAARPSVRPRTAANGGCGMPSSASVRRITILLRHAVGDVRPDRGQPEPLAHGGDDRHGPVGGDGQRAVDVRAGVRPPSTASTSAKSTTSGDVGHLRARARPRSGRPRRREGPARAPARSRGAGGAPRRRRGRSTRRDRRCAVVDARRARVERSARRRHEAVSHRWLLSR